MTMLQGFQIALHALRLNPLRSFLTMLGIVIGVASIVTVFAIGSGAQLRLQEQIRSIGANVLMITPGAVYQGGVRLKDGSKLTMTESDVQAIIEQIPEIQAAAGSIAGTAQVIHESKNWNTTINGTTTGHFMVRDWQLAAGRYFSGTEETGAGKVVILGSTVARELFAPGDDPIGAQIRIMKVPLEVVGVLDRKGPAQDDVAFVPLTTAKLRFLGSASNINRDSVAYIIAKVAADSQMAGARSEIESLLRQRHRIPAGQEDDFKGPGSGRRHGSAAGRDPHRGAPARRHRLGLAARRRHQHHECHDRVGYGAHAGDRNPPRAWRPDAGHQTPVPLRGTRPLPARRRHRGCRRHHTLDDRRPYGRMDHLDRRRSDRPCPRLLDRDRPDLRFLPRPQGIQAEPDRGAQDGVRRCRGAATSTRRPGRSQS
ncbi:hypothetical protein ABIF43_005146 [Bradyrhizobium japonicum]